jgi:signal transduction histidine kinase
MVICTANVPLLRGAVCDSSCRAATHRASMPNQGFTAQLGNFFSKLLNTSDWPARWHCGTWTDFHGWLYIISDIFIWGAYFAIPVLLFRILNKRREVPFLKIFWLFIAFILLCGTTHLIDAIIFWWPAYRLSALVRFFTAVVSVTTVFALYKILPAVYRLRTLAQLEFEIEERKKAEQEARQQQILKQAAEELMAKKDEFMSIASHELKTPITSVKASLQLLQRMTVRNEGLEDVAPFVNKAAKQVNKLTGIVNDLLDVTRIQAGKLELFETVFNVMDMVEECAESCRMEDGKHEIRIRGDRNLTMRGDSNRLEQVLCNFLTNAFKYSADGTLVMIAFEQLASGKVRLEVTDQGIGIAQDKTAHIFDRFFRVEDTSQHFSGIGLGLYISAEIIKQHNGDIGVNSTLGKGSSFWFVV